MLASRSNFIRGQDEIMLMENILQGNPSSSFQMSFSDKLWEI